MNKNITVVLLLVLAAGCSSKPQDGAYAPSMDPTRKVSEQDCSRPIGDDRGNLMCREVTEAERRAKIAEAERQARARREAEERAARRARCDTIPTSAATPRASASRASTSRARQSSVPQALLTRVRTEENGPKQCWLQAVGVWRARQDLNPRPPGS